MNLDQWKQNIVIDKYWGRRYFGQEAASNLPSLKVEAASPETAEVKPEKKTVNESVSIPAIGSWVSQVKEQLERMATDIFAADEDAVRIVRDIQSLLDIHYPRSDETSEGVKEKMEDLYRGLQGMEDKVSGSLKDYILKLSDTVKAVTLDDVADNSPEPESPEGMGGIGGSPTGVAGEPNFDDADNDGIPNDAPEEDLEGEDDEEFDFEKELKKL